MSEQRVAVTGASGQLGKCLSTSIPDGIKCDFFDRHQLDITDSLQVRQVLQAGQYGWCVNTAAYTAVDKAESDSQAAFEINAAAVGKLGATCSELGVRLVHISTDYVYDVTEHTPIQESATCAPRSVYGKSKLQGEQLLSTTAPESIILRTSWLYSEFGHNFVKTMIRLGTEGRSLNIVDDQTGSPTYARDLAHAIWTIVEAGPGTELRGIYNFANSGSTTWYHFAQTIFALLEMDVDISPTTTAQFNAAAPRPEYSVLDSGKLARAIGMETRGWREALKACLQALNLTT